ncbi:MAG: aminopeptidase P family protein [bacterium]|nr:aminopeptidase P family protein [bacterium]
MFDSKVYTERRKLLKEKVKSGVLLFPGNGESPMNYRDNTYHYRQDSTFLYFFGLDKPGFTGLIDLDEGKDYLFGEDFTIDDIIWTGPQPKVKDLAKSVGVENTGDSARLQAAVGNAVSLGRKVHFLPPYRGETSLQLEQLLGISASSLKSYASMELIKAVVALRSIKTDAEVSEIEKALDISNEMYTIVMQMAMSGTYEREIAAKMKAAVAHHGSHLSFPMILSIHGETLHNHYQPNQLADGRLLVADSGAESPEYYASDITRTFPVGGRFSPQQRDIYQVVLDAQLAAIHAMKPGAVNKDLHLLAAETIASGLKALGFMKGNVDDAVKEGAHALFFPHGLGHMMGLDVHDMESFGEDYVGYDDNIRRSDQFGLAYLRLGKSLETGFVLTVEPGIYFIPALIDKWKAENKFTDFIDYSKVEAFKNFGGIRIEDDLLITGDGYRILGKPIPKEIDEIEALMT